MTVTVDRGTATAAGAVAGPRSEPTRIVGPRAAWQPWLGWLAVAAVAALPFAEAVRILVQHQTVVLNGDEALLDLGARNAGHLSQLLGPYSRVGFHQPGPAVLYLLAPFVAALGVSGAGLFLGAIVISGSALVATVVVLWRRAGPSVALWAAVAIDLYCLCLRVGTLREPWNPYLVATPMVLFVVLWAMAMTGSRGAGVWSLAVASYEVQTHIATAGFVVGLSVILVVWVGASQWRAKTLQVAWRRGWGPARITGTVVLALIWVPPVIELWHDHPNNAVALWDSFGSSHATPGLHQALAVAANAVTIVPFGYRDYSLALTRTPAELAVAGGGLALGLFVAVRLGRRRRQPLSLALAAAAVAGLFLGTASLVVAPPPLYLYFAVWMAFVPLSVLLAIGIALFAPSDRTPSPGRSHRRAAPLVGAAVALAALTVQSDLSMASIATSSGAGPWPQDIDATARLRSLAPRDTAALAAAAERVLRPSDHRVVFRLGATTPWPFVAGIVLALDERGVQSTVTPATWDLYFGNPPASAGPPTVQFDLSALPAHAAPSSTAAAAVDGYALTYRRLRVPTAAPPADGRSAQP